MQDTYDIFDDDFDGTDDRQTGQDPSALIKQLRAKAKADKKALDELGNELKTLKAADRTRSLEKVLEEKKIPPKVARLIPESVTAEQVDDWLKEYGELFGVNTTNTEDEGASATGALDRTTLARIDQSAQGGVPPLNKMAEQIHAVKTMPEADFLKLIDDAQMKAS